MGHHADCDADFRDLPVRHLPPAPVDELIPDPFAADGDISRGWPLEMRDAAQQGGLAGTARSDDRDLLANPNGEIDVLEDVDLSEALGQPDGLDQNGRRIFAGPAGRHQANSDEKSFVLCAPGPMTSPAASRSTPIRGFFAGGIT